MQHGLLILLLAWLILTSPWVHLYNRWPASPGFWVWAHAVLGLVALLLGLGFMLTSALQGRLGQYFPWALGRVGPLWADLRGLVRLKVPGNEGAGLFSIIKGLLLLALLATGVTGAMWLWTAGSQDAVAWRGWHIVSARFLIGALVAHVLATLAHLVDFMRQ
ncbi:MAG: hypothetical protein V2J42_00865 [Wenzhouxiangella sp.]|jgi:hypothetical protein|nr:hypothetical protein [Wenzhouxiangella sp.]